jgi:CO/xanthine dehydrogenase Mo-binding subunit
MYFSMGVVAAHLQWPLSKLKFVGGTVGGGFGGKVDTATETICALLAIKARKPVKWRFTREEEFLVVLHPRALAHRAQGRGQQDGWILGRRTLTLHDAGAYSRFSPYGVTKHAFHHTGAYTIPNVRFDGFVVYSNRVPTTAMRGFGVTSVSLATELHLTAWPSRSGWTPSSCGSERQPHRRHHGQPGRHARPVHGRRDARGGRRGGHELGEEYRSMTSDRRTGDCCRSTSSPSRRRPASIWRHTTRPPATEEAGTDGQAARSRLRDDRVPHGDEPERGPTQAWIKLKPDGSVDVFAGTVDIGQGSKTVHTQIVGGRPRRPLRVGDDGQLQHGLVRGLHGHVRLARDVHRRQRGALRGRETRERILDIASKELEISPDDLEIADGTVMAKGAPDRSISWATSRGRPPTSTGSSSRARARRSSRWPRSTTTTAR